MRRLGLGRAPFGALSLCLGLLFASTTAKAHISLEEGGTHKSRYGDAEIKDGPCGRENGKRGTNVYEYKPGETITIKVTEFIGHPGYFRIAFDPDGDDGFMEPRSIKPLIDPATKKPHRECLKDGVDQCGASDFNNNEAVLMDDLDPHVTGPLGTKTYTWKVKLPNVTCNNCTLQIIQVMEDANLHGPYSPRGISKEGAGYVEDIYHQCIDLVLKGDATGVDNPTPPVTGDGDSGDGDTGDGDDSTGDGDGDDSGDGDSSGDGDGDKSGSPSPTAPAAKSDSSCTVSTPGGREETGLLLAFGLLTLAAGARRAAKRRPRNS